MVWKSILQLDLFPWAFGFVYEHAISSVMLEIFVFEIMS